MLIRFLKNVVATTKGRLTILAVLITLMLGVLINTAFISATAKLELQSQKNAATVGVSTRAAVEVLLGEAKALLSLISTSNDIFNTLCTKKLDAIANEPFIESRFSGFAIINEQGMVVCSTFGTGFNLNKLDMFVEAMQSNSFAVGEIQPGQLSGNLVMPVGLPVRLEDGSKFILGTAIKAEALQHILNNQSIAKSSGIFIINNDGYVVAAQHPFGAEYWNGKNVTNSKIFKNLHESSKLAGKGVGLDGSNKFYAIEELKINAKHWHILSTLEESNVIENYFGSLTGSIAISLGILVSSCLLILFLFYWFFLRNIEALKDSTEAILSGISWCNETLPKLHTPTKRSQMTEINTVTHNMHLIRAMLDERIQDLHQSRKIAMICSWKYNSRSKNFIFSTGYESVIPVNNLISLYSPDFLQHLPAEDSLLLTTKLQTLCKQQTPFVVEVAYSDDLSFSANSLRFLEIHGEKAEYNVLSDIGYIGTIQDVTKATRLRKALESSQNFLQSVLDSLSESVIACDATGHLKVFNRVTEVIHGIPMVNLPLNQVANYYSLYNEDGTKLLEAQELPLIRALSGEEFGNERIRIAPKHLPYRIVKAQGKAIKDSSGQILGALVVLEDVTARIKAESRIKQSEEEFKLLFESGADGLAVVDEEGKILLVNRVLADKYGYEQKDLFENSFNQLFKEQDWKRIDLARDESHKGMPTQLELEARHKDGHFILSELCISAINFRDSKAYLSILRDIRERKLVEERIHSLQRVEATGKLIAGIAHDFNNLLQVILMNLDIIEYELEEYPDLLQMLSSAQKAAAKGGELIKHLQAFSRQQALKVERVDVYQLVISLLPVLEAVVGDKLHSNLKESSVPMWVNVDIVKFELALTHLLMNSLDAIADKGKIILDVQKIYLNELLIIDTIELRAGEYCLITIKDNGCGMSESVRKRAFEPFYTTKKVGQGSGLGLSMVFGFMQQSGGGVQLISQKGVGSEIKLYFPVDIESA